MSARSLLTPILDDGVRNTHFFQGRLLSAEDLSAEQDAHREHRRELGRALGAGVVEGLEVTAKEPGGGGVTPTVAVRRGLAVNREGQVLRLPRDVEVALSLSAETAAPPGAGLFAPCQPPVADPLGTGAGIFVLAMSPASGFSEQAPRSGVGADGRAVGCGSRWAVEGVTFRLRQVLPGELASASAATRQDVEDLLATATTASQVSRLRNTLAHLFLGTESLDSFVDDPLATAAGASPYLDYGGLDDLRRAGRLSACDVPLTLLLWTPQDGVLFADAWAVRRRPVPRPLTEKWPILAGTRRRAEAEAILLQFLDQVEDLVRDLQNPGGVRAKDYFRYLPPAGFFPLLSLGAKGFTAASFFTDVTHQAAPILETPRFISLILSSFEWPPLDLSDPEPVWLYQVTGTGAAAPYLVFARSSMAFAGLVSVNTQEVPNLFGKSLAAAVELLGPTQLDLPPGNVLDIYGNVVDPADEDVQDRLVLAQTPQSGDRVPAGTALRLAVTGLPSVGEPPPPPPGPRIVSYDPPATRPGESLTIVGANFGTQPAAATVTFTRPNGSQATAHPTSESTDESLRLAVPAELPLPAPNNTEELDVSVTLADGQSAAGPKLTLLPPPPLAPAISGFSPSPAVEGTNVTINGSGFDYTDGRPAAQKTVFFGSTQVVPSASSPQQVQARVPTVGASPTTPTVVSVRVVADGQSSALVNLGILGPPLPPTPPRPVISSLSPTDVYEGLSVTINGTDFHADRNQNRVEFRRKSTNTLIQSVIPYEGTTTRLRALAPLISVSGITGILGTVSETAGLASLDDDFPDPEPEPREFTVTVMVYVLANSQKSVGVELRITYLL